MKRYIHIKVTRKPLSVTVDIHWWQAVILIALESSVIYFIAKAVG